MTPHQPPAAHAAALPADASPFRLVSAMLWRHRGGFVQAALAAALANLLALATSLYSMQVYDRVIPTQGYQTLAVLTAGAVIACSFELLIRQLRARLLEQLGAAVDHELSMVIFRRLAAVRLEHMPAHAGLLAAQVRACDPVRSFITSASLFLLFDAPFAVMFALAISLLGGMALAFIPLGVLVCGLLVGAAHLRTLFDHARSGFEGQGSRQGVLVEAAGSMESVRALGLQQGLDRRWSRASESCALAEAGTRRAAEGLQLWTLWLQQIGYVAMVGVGAYLVARSETLTMGGLIACSIIASRVLAPFSALSTLLAQWGATREALQSLSQLLALPLEGGGSSAMLEPATLCGRWRLQGVRFRPHPARAPMQFPDLEIRPGERVAIIGPVGVGKSTLLRLLTGLHAPTDGQVLLDGLSVDQIRRACLRRHVAFLPQEPRIMSGTLGATFEDLLQHEPSRQHFMMSMKETGLDRVVAGHPLGLDMPIGDGGAGLSPGQRQLAAFTRLLAAQPAAYVLDEPTSALDEASESRCIAAILRASGPSCTVVVATHRIEWIRAMHRVIALTPDGKVVDGPRDLVLNHLRKSGGVSPLPHVPSA